MTGTRWATAPRLCSIRRTNASGDTLSAISHSDRRPTREPPTDMAKDFSILALNAGAKVPMYSASAGYAAARRDGGICLLGASGVVPICWTINAISAAARSGDTRPFSTPRPHTHIAQVLKYPRGCLAWFCRFVLAGTRG